MQDYTYSSKRSPSLRPALDSGLLYDMFKGNTDVVSVLDIDTERVGHEHGKGLECPCFIGSIPVPLDLQL